MALILPADVVNLAGRALVQDQINRAGVIIHVEPIAHLHPVTINRQRMVVDSFGDKEGQDFFRILIWPKCIAPACDGRVQPIRDVVGPHHEFAARFAGSIRAVWLQWIAFFEEANWNTAVYLVRADLMDTLDPHQPGHIQQNVCPHDVGVNERVRLKDAAIYVRLGGEIHNRINLISFDHALQGLAIRDVAALEPVVWLVVDG